MMGLNLHLLKNDFRATDQILIIFHIMNERNKLYD